MDEAAVAKMIADALAAHAAATASTSSFDTMKADAKAWLKSAAKNGLKGVGLLAVIAGAVVVGHVL